MPLGDYIIIYINCLKMKTERHLVITNIGYSETVHVKSTFQEVSQMHSYRNQAETFFFDTLLAQLVKHIQVTF